MLAYILHELRNRRAAIIGWGLGAGAFVLMYSIFFPTLPSEFTEIPLDSPLYEIIGEFAMATFGSYFGSTILNFYVVILGIYAIINGAGTLVGEDEQGTLELVVTLPLTRWQIVIGKAVAMTVALALIYVIVLLAGVTALAVVSAQIETEVTTMQIVLALLSGFPLVLLFMMLNLFFSALAPSRLVAAAFATVAFAGSFFGENLVAMAEADDIFAIFFPFHYYERTATIVADGPQLSNSLILLTAAVVFVVLAVVAFNQRNLTTSTWPWQRGRAA